MKEKRKELSVSLHKKKKRITDYFVWIQFLKINYGQ